MANAQICNELWAYDISAKSWENITVRSEPCVHTNNTAMCGKFFLIAFKFRKNNCLSLKCDETQRLEISFDIFKLEKMMDF